MVTSPAHAALDLLVQSVTVQSSSLPTTAGLEVYLNFGAAVPPEIAAFQVRTYLNNAGSGISIVSAGVTQIHPYLGPSAQPAVSIVGHRVDAGDISFTGSIPLVQGAGLVRIEIAIPAGTSIGLYEVEIENDSQFTFMADENAEQIPLTISTGGLRIAADLPGDFNRDGIVDAADYVAWRKGVGVMPTSDNYGLWRTNFGRTVGDSASHSSAISQSAAIPEPATTVPLMIVVLVIISRRKAIS